MCDIKSMSGSRWHTFWLCLIVFIGVGVLAGAAYGAPNKCMAPLDIHTPVYAGTRVIGYEHGTAGCPIYVYANGTPVQLVTKNPHVNCTGHGAVYLSRPLKVSEIITAKQDPKGYGTAPDKAPKVENIPSAVLISRKLKRPLIVPPIFECQKGVRVEGLVEGVQVNVSGGPVTPPKNSSSGSTWTPTQRAFVGVSPKLRAGDKIKANQDTDNTSVLASDYSVPKTVKKLPNRLPIPRIIDDVGEDGIPDVLVGATTLNLCDLWRGAVIEVYSVDKKNTKHRVGGGIATDGCNVVPVEPLKKGLQYGASQSLCRLKSPDPRDFVAPTNSINIPEIREPLCDGDIDVIADKTADSSMVWIQVNIKGKVSENGNVTAQGSTTVVPVKNSVPLKTGDRIRVRQDNKSLNSGWSQWVVVESKTAQRCEEREGVEEPPQTPPAQPVCTPGKGKAKLRRDQSRCQYASGSPRAYQGDIKGDKDAVLQKIINTSSDFSIRVVKEFNPKNPAGSGGVSCKSFGPKCSNTQVIATIAPKGSWNNINESCWPFYRIKACLAPVKTGVKFPSTIDIEYEYTCK